MARKAPRRTAERILEAALDLFNRFGEPNVSTTAIATQLGISPGNLYYHYPAKEGIVNALSQRYTDRLRALLQTARDTRDMESGRALLQALLAQVWEYRFLYRDTSDLLSRNRHLEGLFRQVLEDKVHALREMLQALRAAGVLDIEAKEAGAAATSMSLVLTYWLSFEFVRDPRLPPEQAPDILARGAQQVLHLMAPYTARRQSPKPAR